MEKLDGAPLQVLPITGLRRIQDLVHYDGPILTQYLHPRGDHYLYYWCDCDDRLNRWMVLRVAEANVLRLVNRFVPLDYVIPGECRDDYVYFVDMDADGETESVMLVATSAIPGSYAPEKGAFLERSRATEKKFYTVLIEGGWSVNDLGNFPRVFSHAYALLYSLNVLHVDEFARYPWRGGFSTVHFFNWLAGQLPTEDRLEISSFQYASPGFIRFSLHFDTACQVVECVSDFGSREATVRSRYSELSRYIRENSLNDLAESDSADWSSHDAKLTDYATALAETFSSLDAKEFIGTAPTPFASAKIAMTLYRRVQALARFEEDGLVRFAPV